MLWDTISAENGDITMDCSSFRMSRRNTALARGSGSSSSSNSSDTRRLNMDLDLNASGGTPVTTASAALHDMSIDELSFYDDENAAVLQRDFTASPVPLQGLLSPEGSPRRFQVVERTVGNITAPGTDKFLQFGRQQKLPRSTTATATTTITNSTLTTTMDATTKSGNKSFRMFHSLSSSGSMESSSTLDDDYMELLEMESLEQLQDECSQSRLNFPSDLNSLISGPIKSVTPTVIVTHNRSSELLKTPELMRRPSVRRCLSMTENNNYNNSQYHQSMQPKTPELLKGVQETATTPFNSRLSIAHERSSPNSIGKLNHNCFKRPDPPSITNSPVQSKRYRSGEEKENMHMYYKSTAISSINNGNGSGNCNGSGYGSGVPLRKCMSMNDAEIMTALARSENNDEPDLIGDFTKPFVLPLMEGRHCDLKSISSDTVARLLKGEFEDCVANYTIIDCRYPYEYEGGHIRGAKNLYTQEQIIEEFLTQQKTEQQNVRSKVSGHRRNIIIFHCEFSSERGPKLSRFLRNNDRARNTNAYPTLDYPEIYLLHNGYKEFYETHAELCEPVSYRPMLEPSYTEAYRHFRAKSKSWNGDVGCGTTSRFKKSRSRLML